MSILLLRAWCGVARFLLSIPHFLDKKNEQMDNKKRAEYFSKFWIKKMSKWIKKTSKWIKKTSNG
jgi:hypothetical protein